MPRRSKAATPEAPAPTLLEREHGLGLHGSFQPHACGACWPNGAPVLTRPSTTVEAPVERELLPRRRGDGGLEPLGNGLRRFVASLKVDQPTEPPRDPSIADDGGPVCGTCKSRRFVGRGVEADHPDFGRAFACTAPACAAFMRSRRLERFWREVPDDVRDGTLETYPQRGAEQRQSVEMVTSWRTWPSMWLLLWGAAGRGKTGLAVAAARALGDAADFVKVPDMLRKIAGTYDRDGRERDHLRELDLLERLWSVPCLVLDDFGVEAPTAWASERIYQVVDGRASEPRLVTIITSNLSPAALRRRLAQTDPNNGERVMSRILGRCGPFVVEVGGPDLRQRAFVRSTLKEAN